MPNKTILILGGGIGGIVAANELRKHLGTGHRIIIVDKNRIQTLGLTYLWIMVGWRKAYAIERDLSLLEKKGIEFHHAVVKTIDLHRRRVETEKETLDYDYLIIALGAEYAWESIPGLSSSANTFYSLEGAEDLQKQLMKFAGGTISLVVTSTPYKCPPAPYEAALLIESFLRRKSVREKTKIDIFIPEPAPMQIAGPDAARALQELLAQRKIGLITSHRIRSYDAANGRTSFETGASVSSDLTIFVPPHRSPAVVREAQLTNASGWIPVDKRTLQTAHENVYALGDVTTIPLASGLSLPKAGIFAMNQAEVAAHNIAIQIIDGKKQKTFDGSGYCFIEVGDGKAGYITGDFFAEPAPKISFHDPSSAYHWGKVVFEKYWLWRWF